MPEPKRHQPETMNLKALLGVLGALTGSAIAIHVALAGLLWVFMRGFGTAGQLPAEPSPPAHLYQRAESERLLAEAQAKLQRSDGGRMPIERAMGLVVERGWRPEPKPGGRR